jgi:inosose dehydratase
LDEEFGLHQQFHSHADAHVGTHSEVERFLELTDERYTNLCLDTGHFSYYGGDNLGLIADHPSRIGYLHLKQVDPVMIFDVLKSDTPFGDAVGAGIMVEPDQGIPPLDPIIEAVAALDEDIFAIVEQDMFGCSVDAPFPIAQRTLQTILTSTEAAVVDR